LADAGNPTYGYKIAINRRLKKLGGQRSMVPSFDILKIHSIGDVLRRDAVESLAVVRVRIEKLTTSSPGEYVIFDQKTGQKICDAAGCLCKTWLTGGI
jgi:hypothetical protein